MSLIRVRRDRKREGSDARKGKPTKTLFFLLVFVGIAIWFLTVYF